MSWTIIDSDGAASDGTSATTITSPGLTVAAGDLAVVLAKWEGGVGGATTATCSDGTSSLTAHAAGRISHGGTDEPHMDVFYILSSVANGTNSVVYTVTFGTSVPWRNIVVYTARPSAACSLDGTATGTSGTSTTPDSGSITTTGTDGLAFGAHGTYGGNPASMQINGVAATGSQAAGADFSKLWYITYSSGFTGDATCTISSNRWVQSVIAFTIAGGGGGGGSVDLAHKWTYKDRPNRPAPFKPMGDAFRPDKYRGWR